MMWSKRAHARAGLLAWLLVLSTLLLTSTLGARQVLADSSARALTETIAGAPVDDRTVLVQTRVGDADQEQIALPIIADALPGIEISSAVRTPALPIVGSDQRLTLAVDPDAMAAAELTGGAWPAALGEASLHETAAQNLQLAIGDSVAVSADGPVLEFTIVGLWRPADPAASIWGQDATSRTGSDTSAARAFGPAFITADTLAPAAIEPFIQWRLLPDEVSLTEVEAWQGGLAHLADDLTGAGVSVRGLTVTGGLATTLEDATAGLAAVRGVTPIALMLLGLVGAIALWQILRLLGEVRERETVTLTARGASRGQFVAWGLAEGACVAIPAAVITWVVLVIGLSAAPGETAATVAILGAGIVILAVIAAWRAAGARLVGGRARAIVASLGTLAIAGVAAFSGWRLLRNGSPLVPGSTRIDVLAVIAPAAVILTVAAVGVLAAGPLLRLAGAVAARGPGFSPVTELRFASRRPAHGLLIILVALLSATATLTAGYLGSWQSLRTTAAQVNDGAAIVLTGMINSESLEIYRNLAGVEAAAGVYSSPVRTDTGTGMLTALSKAGYSAVQAPASIFNPDLANVLDPGPVLTGINLPAGSNTLEVGVTASAKMREHVTLIESARSLEVSVWVWDGDVTTRLDVGSLRLPAAGDLIWDFENPDADPVYDWGVAGTPVTANLTIDLPVTGGAWRIVALDTVYQLSGNTADVTFRVDSLAVDGSAIDLAAAADFAPDTLRASVSGSREPITLGAGPLSYAAELSDPDLDFGSNRRGPQRFMPTRTEALVIPVATTPGWTGSETESVAQITGGQVRINPVQVIPVVPGNNSPSAALADLGAVAEAVLRDGATRIDLTTGWVATSDPQVADQISVATPTVQVHPASGSSWSALSGLAPALFAGISGLGLVLLIPALIGAGLSELRERRGEVIVLRALGASAQDQAASRRRELGWVAAGAAVFGIGAGVLTSWLLVPPLIRATTPQVSLAIPLRLAFDPLTIGIGLAAGLAVFGVVLWWYGRGVRNQVTDTLWREDIL